MHFRGCCLTYFLCIRSECQLAIKGHSKEAWFRVEWDHFSINEIFALHFASRVHVVNSEISDLVAFDFIFPSLLKSETAFTVFCTFISATSIVSPAPCTPTSSAKRAFRGHHCEDVDVEDKKYWNKNRILRETLSHGSGVTEFVVEPYFGLSVL